MLQMGGNLELLPEPGDRYSFVEEIGQGAFGRVFSAQDCEANSRKVAIKVQKIEEEVEEFIKQEYVVLKDFCNHSNLVEFYGAFRSKEKNEIWFVIEVCIEDLLQCENINYAIL